MLMALLKFMKMEVCPLILETLVPYVKPASQVVLHAMQTRLTLGFVNAGQMVTQVFPER